MSDFIKLNIEGVEKEYKRDEICLYDDGEGSYYIANTDSILSLIGINDNNNNNSYYSEITKEEYEIIQEILDGEN